MRLTDQQLDDLTGYADGEARVRRQARLTSEALREAALNSQVEKCPGCGWWAESHEMVPHDSDDPDGCCLNCRPSEA
jgi:hypothetical protein